MLVQVHLEDLKEVMVSAYDMLELNDDIYKKGADQCGMTQTEYDKEVECHNRRVRAYNEIKRRLDNLTR